MSKLFGESHRVLQRRFDTERLRTRSRFSGVIYWPFWTDTAPSTARFVGAVNTSSQVLFDREEGIASRARGVTSVRTQQT